ncbi:hypothetical protein V6N12_014490 [Hibiscus sabdariffa]|uniref:Uncharacterized protein n=1 Tax=Hibiscus sabdariffa TaxID=183260 RepID=A0ABR2DKP9_9ROSI
MRSGFSSSSVVVDFLGWIWSILVIFWRPAVRGRTTLSFGSYGVLFCFSTWGFNRLRVRAEALPYESDGDELKRMAMRFSFFEATNIDEVGKEAIGAVKNDVLVANPYEDLVPAAYPSPFSLEEPSIEEIQPSITFFGNKGKAQSQRGQRL